MYDFKMNIYIWRVQAKSVFFKLMECTIKVWGHTPGTRHPPGREGRLLQCSAWATIMDRTEARVTCHVGLTVHKLLSHHCCWDVTGAGHHPPMPRGIEALPACYGLNCVPTLHPSFLC